jgi:uncharacterized protein (UPF0333 family)
MKKRRQTMGEYALLIAVVVLAVIVVVASVVRKGETNE